MHVFRPSHSVRHGNFKKSFAPALLTYFVTSSSLSCRWKAIICHNRLAPAQSIREFECAQEYPRTGGLSGNIARNRESFSLNAMNVLSDLISAGTKFQRGAPNTAKEPSYRDWFLCEHTLTSAYIFSQILLHDSYIFSQISLKKRKKKYSVYVWLREWSSLDETCKSGNIPVWMNQVN